MASRNPLDRSALLDMARALTPLQRQIVLSLRDRGPGLLLEVAVRVLKFPEEVSQPIADLRDKRLLEFSKVSGGAFGGEMIALSPGGEQMASALRDEAFLEQLQQVQQPSQSQAWSPQEQEVTLLQRLGDLAAQNGDVAAASNYHLPSAEQAIAEMRGDFKALLRQQDYEVLRQQARGEELTNEEAVREVLYTGCLLEYLNGEPWFGIHPLVQPLIERPNP